MAGSRALTAVLTIVALGAALVAYVSIDRISVLTATETAGRSAVWVNTPHVAPGDSVAIDVVVKGGKRLGIESVVVRDGERELEVTGEGQTWGSSITSRRRDSGQDDVELAIAVPPDANPGDTMRLELEVSWIAAESDGVSSFENVSGTDRILVDVPIRTPAMRVLYRLRSALWALALLALSCGLLALAGRKLGPALNRKDEGGNAESLGLLMIIGIMAYGFAGYGWFAQPLVAATGILGTWFVVVAVILWIAVPIYVAVKIAKRAKKYTALTLRAVAIPDEVPYRTMPATDRPPDRTAEPRPLEEVITAVRRAGLAVRPRRKGFDLRKDGEVLRVRVVDPARVEPRAMTIRATDSGLNLDLAFALVPVFGALAAGTGVAGELVIDRRRDRAAVDAELGERLRALVQQVRDRLARTQPMWDEISRKLGQ